MFAAPDGVGVKTDQPEQAVQNPAPLVADPSAGCLVFARGESRTPAAAAIRVSPSAAAAGRNSEPAAAYREIWVAGAWAFAGHNQSGATAMGLHI